MRVVSWMRSLDCLGFIIKIMIIIFKEDNVWEENGRLYKQRESDRKLDTNIAWTF